jgi:hypothetical protein
MASKRAPEHKILSFTTTLRNPERIAGFLTVLKQFDGQVLTNGLIDKIAKSLIQEKLYWTTYLKATPNLKTIYADEDLRFTDEQLSEIIIQSPQKHKEHGFDEGWPSRFDTWYKICKEFGFAYYEIGQPIKISQAGYMLCDAFGDRTSDEDVSKKIQNVFLNALAKYPSNNPFRRNANENVPVVLLMRVIRLLKGDKSENGAGISRKEIPFVMCWPNNDANELYLYLKGFRRVHGFTASDDTVYSRCLELLNSTNEKRFKKVQVTKEGPDDFLRKLRITGVFSSRGMGRFLDLNDLEHQKVDYIISTYSTYRTFQSEAQYYEFVGLMDPGIISIETDTASYNIADIRRAKLVEIASKYTPEAIRAELNILSSGRRKSSDLYLSDIDEPTRLEFLTSVALQQSLTDAVIRPNYAIDDEGNPTFTARGGVGDIEVLDKDNHSLFEVTLLRSKQQAVLEIPGITRHLQELQKERKFAVFVAPVLHPDTEYMIAFTKSRHDLDIYGFTIPAFCTKLEAVNTLKQFTAA